MQCTYNWSAPYPVKRILDTLRGMPHPSPRDVASRYFELVLRNDADGVVALFADDAEMIPAPRPGSGSHRGRGAIEAHYRSALNKPLRFAHLQMYESGLSCVVEIQVEVGDDRRPAELVDVFTLDENGKIVRLSVYRR
jgi:ketosteroid isomerase-like protein